MIHCRNLSFVFLFVVNSLMAAPMNGEEYDFTQPDGSVVSVHLFGDELNMFAESSDGFTLIRGEDGWLYYAGNSGEELVSTGIRYTGKPVPVNVKKGLRTSGSSQLKKRNRNRINLGDGEEEQMRGFRGKFYGDRRNRSENMPVVAPGTKEVKGFALFISFPDYPAPNDDGRFLRYADSLYNQKNFRGNGSIYDYFNVISNGNFEYTNYISVWIEAPNTFAYYDAAPNYGKVQELITAVLTKLRDDPQYAAARKEIVESVSTYNRSSGRPVTVTPTTYAMNIHPIRSGQNWANGIWSHRGWYSGGVKITDGGKTVGFYDYQFTGLGNSGTITSSTSISIGTIAHENGHMLFDWPDLYPYVSGQRNFVANYCVMSTSGQNPVQPNPFLREKEGWIEVSDITDMNATLSHTAESYSAYKYIKDQYESYYVEARRRIRPGSTANLTGQGLVIWHVNTRGNNADYEVGHAQAARRIPMVAVMQANNGTGSPGASAVYNNIRSAFHKNTVPAAQYHAYGAPATDPNLWAGELSEINITEVSALNTSTNTMTFKIGTGDPLSSSSAVQSSGSVAPSSSSNPNSSSSSVMASSSSALITVSCVLPDNLVEGTLLNNSTQRGYLKCSNTDAAPASGTPTWSGIPKAPIAGGVVAVAGDYTEIAVTANCGTRFNVINAGGMCNHITISGLSSSSFEMESSSSESTELTHIQPLNNGNLIRAEQSGIYLQTQNNATLLIFDLKGTIIRTQKTASGSLRVSLSDLPQGLYVVKAYSGLWSSMVKVLVR
ncbi:MAG: M6 family metalloprotease domain-containing protein [Fibrobacter sp.]|jgi:M6 family metalloprotease-like protein|nr:M6 family metalloprotease domain-containing protein [Fibrobacter sp.]